MRISTQGFFEGSAAGMNALQQQLFRTQQKLGAGTRFLTPADDPVSAARAIGVDQSIAAGAQYATSRSRAVQSLSIEENALQSAAGSLEDIKTLIVQAGNGTLSDADRATLATALEGDFASLLRTANSDDGNGQYLFAGFKSAAPPFVEQPDGSVTYDGDVGQRLAQVDVARQMPQTDDGVAVFQSVQGSAAHVPAAGSPGTPNKGTGVIASSHVADTSDYSLTFDATGQYTVTDLVTKASTTAPFNPGQPITLNGLTVRIDGTPADQDVFTFTRPAAGQADVFGAIRDMINRLRTPLTDGVAQAALRNDLATANVQITNAHDNVLTIRSAVGSRLAELDALDAAGDARKTVDQQMLSGLRDLDYAGAVSEFAQRETALKATQQTFARLQGIALFNYL